MPKGGKSRKSKNKNNRPIQERDVGIETPVDEYRIDIDIEPIDIKDSNEEAPSSNDEVSERVEESKIQAFQKEKLDGLEEVNLSVEDCGKSFTMDNKISSEETPTSNYEVSENVEEFKIQDSQKETLNGSEEVNLLDEECGKGLTIYNKNSNEETPTSNDEVSENLEESKIQDSQMDTLNGLEEMNVSVEDCGNGLTMDNKNSNEDTPTSNDKVSENVEESKIQDSQKDTINSLEEDNLLDDESGKSLAMDIKGSRKETPTSNDEVSENVETIKTHDTHEKTLIGTDEHNLMNKTGQSQENYNNMTAIDNLTYDRSLKQSNNGNGSVSNGPNSSTLLTGIKEVANLYKGAISNLLTYISHLKEKDGNNLQEEILISKEKTGENATEIKAPQEELQEGVDTGDNTNIEQTIQNLMKYLKIHLVKTDELLQKQIQTIKRLTGDNNGSLKNQSQEYLEVRVTELEKTLRESPFLVATLAESLHLTNIRNYELEQTLHMSQTSVTSLEETLQNTETHVTDLEETLQMSKAQIPELQKTLQTYQARVNELEGTVQMEKTNVTNLEEMLQTSKARVTEKERMLQMSEDCVTELEGMLKMSRAHVSELEEKLQLSGVRVTEVEQALQLAQVHNTELEGTLNVSVARVSELESKLLFSQARATEFEESLEKSQVCVTELVGTLQTSQARVSELEGMLQKLEGHVTELEDTLKASEALVKELKGTLEMSGAHVTELEGKLKKSGTSATVLEGMLLMSQARVTELERKANKDKTQIIELEDMVKILDACRKDVERKLRESQVPQSEKRKYERNSMHDVNRCTPDRNKRTHYPEDCDSAAED